LSGSLFNILLGAENTSRNLSYRRSDLDGSGRSRDGQSLSSLGGMKEVGFHKLLFENNQRYTIFTFEQETGVTSSIINLLTACAAFF